MRRFLIIALVAVALAGGGVDAKTRSRAPASGVPVFDIKRSCSAGQAGATGAAARIGFNGCMQEEMKAKADVARLWPKAQPADRAECAAEAGSPSPSYVDLLTCLQADLDPMLPWGRL